MSTSRLERQYHCWNDCQMQGCPGHTANVEFQSTSDHIWFKDGKGHELGGNPVEFGALLSMLYELAGWRTEISSMLDEAKHDAEQHKRS